MLTQLGNGLTTLSTAVQTQIAPNLQKLGEYGAVAGFVTLPAPAGGTTTGTPSIVSSDIPDDGNPATVSGTIPLDLTTLPAAAGTATLKLRAAIRSNEADGGATGDPAGQVGAALVVTCGGNFAAPTTTCGDGTTTFTPGETVCTLVNDIASFPTPAGALSIRAVNIQQKDPRSSPAKPDTGSQDVFASNAAATDRSCLLTGGAEYVATPTAEFFYIPTSATPGPKD